MLITSETLPADMSGLLHAPAPAPSGPRDPSLRLAPNAERLGRWYGERLSNERRWALIVEPHRKIAELIAYLLDFELGIQAVAVPGVRLIPSLFRRWSPDLVVAEVSTSSGAPSVADLASLQPLLDVTQAQCAPLPVILCTTYTEVTPEMARSAGFSGLVYKPFQPSTLVATVRAVLRHTLESQKWSD